MRETFERRNFDVGTTSAAQTPRRIIIHRQGNPGAKALNSLNWGKRERAFTIHSYVGDGICYDAIPSTRHAFHVLEASIAAQRGFRVMGEHGRRGDYDSIGIETEDVRGGAPGQVYSLTQESRITLLLRTAEYLREFGLTPAAVSEHADWDPVNRPEDVGDALNLDDFRADLTDYLAGREPWRTVQASATGKEAPPSWRPAPSVPIPPPVSAAHVPPRVDIELVVNGVRLPLAPGEYDPDASTPQQDLYRRAVDLGNLGKGFIVVGVARQ